MKHVTKCHQNPVYEEIMFRMLFCTSYISSPHIQPRSQWSRSESSVVSALAINCETWCKPAVRVVLVVVELNGTFRAITEYKLSKRRTWEFLWTRISNCLISWMWRLARCNKIFDPYGKFSILGKRMTVKWIGRPKSLATSEKVLIGRGGTYLKVSGLLVSSPLKPILREWSDTASDIV